MNRGSPMLLSARLRLQEQPGGRWFPSASEGGCPLSEARFGGTHCSYTERSIKLYLCQ